MMPPCTPSARARRHAGRERAAFTLLELLIAVGITAALAGAMLSVTTGTLNVWRRVQGNQSAMARAKQALDFLERDLRGAWRRADRNRWLAVEMPNAPVNGWQLRDPLPGPFAAVSKPDSGASFLAVPPGAAPELPPAVAAARFGMSGTWLRFFTSDAAGEPIAVSYQIVRLPQVVRAQNDAARQGPSHYLFVRTATDAATTLATGYDITDQRYQGTFGAPRAVDVLADHVVDFGIWFFVRDGSLPSGLRRIYPNGPTDDARYVFGGGVEPEPERRFPEVADVMMRVLTEEGATSLANLENGRLAARPARYSTNDEWWWGIAREHSQVFVRRIVLPGGGP